MPGGQSASFNARTGKFQPTDTSYAVDHLEEWNRAKRQAGKYFDVELWEAGIREENAKKRRDAEMGVGEEKKISKKDMVRPCLDHVPIDKPIRKLICIRSDSERRRRSKS